MNSSARVERRRVYLAYRELFSGKNARVRQEKAIRSIVHESAHHEKDSINAIIHILKSLLDSRVFESEAQARQEFPELRSKSSRGRQTNKASKRFNTSLQTPMKVKHFEHSDKANSLSQTNPYERDATNGSEGVRFPLNTHPPEFSFDSQHRVLVTIQKILEESCFNFTKTWLPTVLENRDWSCVAAVELTKWLQIMTKRVKDLPEDCMDKAGRATLSKIGPRLAQLRHTAVHRLHPSSDELAEQIRAALQLGEVLRDDSCTSKLNVVRSRLEASISKTKRDTEAMKQEMNRAFLVIEKRREALDREVQQLRSATVQQLSLIPKAADQALLDCVDELLEIRKPERPAESRNETCRDDNTGCFSRSVYVDEDDIESDEDQLQADLG